MPNGESRIESFKTRNGCNTVSVKPIQTKGFVQFHNCFCNHLDYGFGALMNTYDNYTKGHLPHQGSYLSQPNKIIEAFSLISHLKNELEEKLQKQNKGKR